MARIHQLESPVVDQIAAGEVIERPASVLKELVENALDAGAHRIQIEIEGSGLGLIRVLDDGEGILPEDLPLALERHATSKIRQLDDLERIRTMGFRGEALPSIAAVSRLRLSSRARAGAEGAEIDSRGGRTNPVRPCAHPPGTRVEVRDLFHNTPARRKFLRTPAGEARAIAALVSQFAMAHPQTHFIFSADSRPLLDAPPARDLRERAARILGTEALEHLLDVDAAGEHGLEVRGLVSDPQGARGNSSAQWLYVNLRMVRDRALSFAIREAASEFIPRGRHAAAYLFLALPPRDLDVNVHPGKWEVRFARPDRVRSLVYGAVRDAARRNLAFGGAPMPLPEPAPLQPEGGGRSSVSPGGPAAALQSAAPGASSGGFPALSEPAAIWAGTGGAVARPLPLDAGAHPEFLRPLGQYRESFILATDGRDLLIVDQHVAHERILYERILRDWEQGKVERQALLLPQPVTLSPEEMLTYRFLRPTLEEAGFRIEPFGEREVILREAPAAAGLENTEGLIHALLEEGEEARRGRPLESLRQRLAASCACHAAIKIHTPLTREKMEFLLRELLRTRTPFLCPHGRPIVLRLGTHALERSFGRC